MKIKPTIAYAVIKKAKMQINALDIFAHKDIELGEDEVIIKVEIKPMQLSKPTGTKYKLKVNKTTGTNDTNSTKKTNRKQGKGKPNK